MTSEQKSLFIIFGGTGDLAQRKLYPSLFNLYKQGYLKENFAVIGTARRPWTNERYQQIVRNSISGMEITARQANEFSSHFYYQSHNVNDTQHYETLRQLADELDKKYAINGNRVFYLAMSPQFFSTICEHVKTQGLVTDNGYNRVVIEKPFGRDVKSAVELNDSINQYFPEDDVYRIDHYLGKEMIQSIPALRFSNNIFNALWNYRYIDNIQITLSEALGVEERAGYYENAGALRDMVQNHILQTVALLTMNAPTMYTDADIRKEKISALKALRVYDQAGVKQNFVFGQYGAGNGQAAYREENQVAPDSKTETFVAGKIFVDNMSMAGVPIYVRTGKRLTTKNTQIDVVFKNAPYNIFGEDQLKRNILTFKVDPNPGMELRLNGKKVDFDQYSIQSMHLKHEHGEEIQSKMPVGYEKLLYDVLQGDTASFSHWDEVYYSWRFVDAIRQGWQKQAEGQIDLYPAGSMGPKGADDLLAADGNQWHFRPDQG
ncbi:glucose-6-phosphate 1-dehydrogenase [Ligilactobacillus salitolerans]|uniref:Glucose-6-phosphate 1-dehydrogenase n=1 Tax=Ligilactobacillus salitolerans TaxID=1808352 RepID=A0A401ISR5_9LACO|nr:glucose-6-phosphate dehydrogenase [Ligilactobacillus salitolerans]GBG94569.1 glucose-6-phosphate 1-dehydrogenase [Ligilactobacillus salitolerans]